MACLVIDRLRRKDISDIENKNPTPFAGKW